MNTKVSCGSFEPEAYWRDPSLAMLPALANGKLPRVVEAMDELLFAFCDPGDKLLTAKRMNEAHVAYLHSLGFEFLNNKFDVYPNPMPQGSAVEHAASNIFAHLASQPQSTDLSTFVPPCTTLEPFAVLPGAKDVAQRYQWTADLPSMEVVQRVNRKTYSLNMRDILGLPRVGETVDNLASFLQVGAEILGSGSLLIKDDYGVSGKGNLLIDRERMLQRIGRHLATQCESGRRVEFVLEPYLPRWFDFSCQFFVTKNGHVDVISTQRLENSGLAFGTSYSADAEFLEQLDQRGYFQIIRQIGSILSSDGYFGHVCVDSMLLEDGGWVPLVEINARKSMSLIKHAVDSHLDVDAQSVCLTSIAAMIDGSVHFEDVLERMQRWHLLFMPGRECGVIPLTSGTLFTGSQEPLMVGQRGKLYVAIVHASSAGQKQLLSTLSELMRELGLRTLQ